MNLALVSLLGRFPGLAKLLPLAEVKRDDLTLDHLRQVAVALGREITINDELLSAVVSMLKGKDINDVADLVQSPESLEGLLRFFTGGINAVAPVVAPSFEEGAADLFIA